MDSEQSEIQSCMGKGVDKNHFYLVSHIRMVLVREEGGGGGGGGGQLFALLGPTNMF